jgi:hypothetical protein
MKKSKPDSERQAALDAASLYVINCQEEKCGDEELGLVCTRGFFSLFIQAVNGIRFASQHGLHYYVNFGNGRYLYSDDRFESQNFWDYYFIQPLADVGLLPGPQITNRMIEVFPLRIWHRSYLREIHETVIQEVEFTTTVKKHMEEKVKKILPKKTLGVQIRGTDHVDEIDPVSEKSIYRAIDSCINKFEKLFVATDEDAILLRMKERYGQKVIFNPVTRSKNKNPVHLNFAIEDKFTLGLDVLSDCYCLSHCEKLILTSSNVSYSALLFNPEIPYILLERPSARLKRWKTLIAYLLDKWNIRKW